MTTPENIIDISGAVATLVGFAWARWHLNRRRPPADPLPHVRLQPNGCPEPVEYKRPHGAKWLAEHQPDPAGRGAIERDAFFDAKGGRWFP